MLHLEKLRNPFLENWGNFTNLTNRVCLTASFRAERRGMTGCDCVSDRAIACFCFGGLVTVPLLQKPLSPISYMVLSKILSVP